MPPPTSTASISSNASSSHPVGFIRVKLLQCEPDGPTGDTFDPFVAVNVKEAVQVPGKGTQLIQKKKTIYPEWNTCFDAHLYDGRTIQMSVMEPKVEGQHKLFADISISAQLLADKCKEKDGNVATITLDLKPKGRLIVQVRYFTVDEVLKASSRFMASVAAKTTACQCLDDEKCPSLLSEKLQPSQVTKLKHGSASTKSLPERSTPQTTPQMLNYAATARIPNSPSLAYSSSVQSLWSLSSSVQSLRSL